MIKVLLIEDSVEDQLMFQRLVKQIDGHDFSVETSSTSEDAVSKMKNSSFDVVFMDIHLPDASGSELFKKFDAAIKETAFIAMTGQENEQLIDEISQFGILDYLIKSSLSSSSLKRSIRYATSRHEAQRREKSLQSQLIHTQKMNALGELTGGIAHDFNNKLAVIEGQLYLLAKEGVDEKQSERVQKIQNTVKTSADLVKKLLAFGRRQEVFKESVDLCEVVKSLVDLHSELLPKNVILTCNFKLEKACIEADVTQIDQIITNLIVNSRDSFQGKGGEITITVSSHHACDAPSIKRSLDVEDVFLLKVEDNGSGMDEVTTQSATSPFFTTKKADEGTGLGLSVVDGIVEQHNGCLDIQSQLGSGTSVSVYFPKSTSESPVTGKTNPKSDRFETVDILFVDDNEDFREVTITILSDFGFNIVAVSDAASALKLIENDPLKFDAVLSDFNMPGMTGLELKKEVRKILPEIGFVFLSGYSESEISQGAVMSQKTRFFSKPCDIHSVVEALRSFRSLKEVESIKAS